MRVQSQTQKPLWWAIALASLCTVTVLVWHWISLQRSQSSIPPEGKGSRAARVPGEDAASAGPSIAALVGGHQGRLSLEQSRQLVRLGLGEGPVWSAYSKAHPAVREEMLALLEDESVQVRHVNALYVLAYVADDTDIPRLRKWLDKREGQLRRDARDSVTVLFEAVGITARRGCPAASAWLKEMTTIAYWVPPKFSYYPPEFPGVQPAEYETLCRVMLGYALSHPVDLRERVQNILVLPYIIDLSPIAGSC